MFKTATLITDSVVVQALNPFGQLGICIGTNPSGRHVLSNIHAGPTIVVTNENQDGDVAVDFHTAGRFAGKTCSDRLI